MDTIDRFAGCLLGLAVGDALGAPVEFAAPGSFTPIDEMRAGGTFGLQAGQWTDDTSMALCLADSLINRRGFDPRDQLECFLRWYRQGYFSSTGTCFDIGNTTREALEQFENTHCLRCGPDGNSFGSNGSLMRLAPVPMAYSRWPQAAIDYSGHSSETTHPAETAVDSCRYLGALIYGALNGVPKATLLSPAYEPLPGYWNADPLSDPVHAVAEGSFLHRNPPEIIAGSRADQCLEAALWAFANSDSFEQGCLLAVNLGNDADTTGAVYGQLAGAFYGQKTIPERWLQPLTQKETLEHMIRELFELSTSIEV